MDARPITSDYNLNFDSEWFIHNYLDSSLEHMNRKSANLLTFCLDKMHDVFKDGTISGSTLLDIGTGPTIHSVISASDHVRDIYLSEFAASNRQILFDWLENKRVLDSTTLKYVLKKQANTQLAQLKDKERQLRSQVKAILPVDVTAAKPLGNFTALTEFDVITTKLCLESATHNVDEYQKCVKNMVSLLRQGGYLVVAGVLGEKFYRVGNFNFTSNYVQKEEIIPAYENAGVDILNFYETDDAVLNENTDFEGVFVLLAKKK